MEHNSIDTSNLNNQQFRLNKFNEIGNYFFAEIKERELKSKYIAFFYYFDKSLIVLSAASYSISIASFATVIVTSIGIASASLSFKFSLCTGPLKISLKSTRNKKKNIIKFFMLAISKLNSIESKISEALMSNQISHGDFMPIIKEERNYRELKESIKM